MSDYVIHHGPSVLAEQGLPETSWLVEPLIPSSGCTLLHGPTSVGKSALVWAIANAVQAGESIFGMKVIQADVLFVSIDMTEIPLRIRWFGSQKEPKSEEDRFDPLFDYVAPSFLSIMDPNWVTSPLGVKFRKTLTPYGFVIFDALGSMVGDTNDPGTATKTHQILRQIMGSRPYILIHHDRQALIDSDGLFRAPSDDDASGSKRWQDLSQHQLHFYKINHLVRHLKQGKSQLAAPQDEPWRLYVTESGKAELYEEHVAKSYEIKITQALHQQKFASKKEAYAIVMARYKDIGESTVRRWFKHCDYWTAHPLK